MLLSSLAQGADQLCATVALEKGLQVIAPLPFPAALYLQSSSFDSDKARLQCEALLKDPRVTAFVTPLPEEEMSSTTLGWARLLEADGTRHRCYANAGGYVVLHCHALIALWDGEESGASAGTAQMVQFKRAAGTTRQRRTRGRSHFCTGLTAARCTSCTRRAPAHRAPGVLPLAAVMSAILLILAQKDPTVRSRDPQ